MHLEEEEENEGKAEVSSPSSSSSRDIVVKESFGGRIVYKIDKSVVPPLGEVFAALEDSKSLVYVEEYSFSQATLEQVFLDFAKKQELD